MIAVPVCIKQKTRFIRTEFGEFGFDFVSDIGKLCVNRQKSVRADRNADIAALSE